VTVTESKKQTRYKVKKRTYGGRIIPIIPGGAGPVNSTAIHNTHVGFKLTHTITYHHSSHPIKLRQLLLARQLNVDHSVDGSVH